MSWKSAWPGVRCARKPILDENIQVKNLEQEESEVPVLSAKLRDFSRPAATRNAKKLGGLRVAPEVHLADCRMEDR